MDPCKRLCAATHKSDKVRLRFNNLLLLKVVSLAFMPLTSSRCGLTLALSTNLVLWMAAVAEESVHQTEVPLLNISYKTYRGTQTRVSLLTDR